MKRVLLFGAYANGNLGDAEQAASVARHIKAHDPSIEIVACSHSTADGEYFPAPAEMARNMTAIMDLRKRVQDDFVARHGVKLGFMSFFIKAVVDALQAVPAVNAQIEGDEIIENHFYDIGVAVGTDKGLMVPVIRDCEQKSFAGIEKDIVEYANKARDGKISLADLQGGVFTITNGGIYGSLLSTPILNPPQSGILGMHSIQQRPVALNGQVVIRPMMYLALSYDHRLVDGKEAVTFLVRVKDGLENPARLMLG